MILSIHKICLNVSRCQTEAFLTSLSGSECVLPWRRCVKMPVAVVKDAKNWFRGFWLTLWIKNIFHLLLSHNPSHTYKFNSVLSLGLISKAVTVIRQKKKHLSSHIYVAFRLCFHQPLFMQKFHQVQFNTSASRGHSAFKVPTYTHTFICCRDVQTALIRMCAHWPETAENKMLSQ